MKKSLSLVLALSVISAMGNAQANLDKEVDTELNTMYSSGKTPAPAAQAQNSGQPIYILNQATPTATSSSVSGASANAGAAAVQKQPTTLIEASPLMESRAEALRKARQDAETSTEAKIVEKLEASRLEDEKRRAQALFGDRMQNQVPAQSEGLVQPTVGAPAQQQQQAPQIYIIPQQTLAPAPAPTPAVAPLEKKEEAPIVIDKAAEKEVVQAAQVENEMAMAMPVAPTSQKYFTGSVGVLTAPDAEDYVQGNYALGFTFGNKYDDTYAVEGSFIYANSEVKNKNNYMYYGAYDVFDVNQYTGAIAMKWYMLKGMVKPILGALTQYSYRDFKFSDKNIGAGNIDVGTSNSHAIDVGAIVGMEVEFNPKMTLGLDVRYLKNLIVRRNYSTQNYSSNPYSNSYGFRTPIEDLDYYTVSLSARVSF